LLYRDRHIVKRTAEVELPPGCRNYPTRIDLVVQYDGIWSRADDAYEAEVVSWPKRQAHLKDVLALTDITKSDSSIESDRR
jgi:hypothetical protein